MNRNLVYGTVIYSLVMHSVCSVASDVVPIVADNVAGNPAPQENMEKIQQYREAVEKIIHRNLVVPSGLPNSLITEVQIHILPTGEVMAIYMMKSSGYKKYDASVVNAIERSSPLPATKDWFMPGNLLTIHLDIHN